MSSDETQASLASLSQDSSGSAFCGQVSARQMSVVKEACPRREVCNVYC